VVGEEDEEAGRASDAYHPAPSSVSTNTTHLEETDGEESSDEVGQVVDRPEEGKTEGEVVLRVCARQRERQNESRMESGAKRERTVVGKVEDAVRDETTLEESDEETVGEERGATVHGELGHGEDGEDDELGRKPDVDT
jgi:hypothetical protein